MPDIEIAGAVYPDVPEIQVPRSGGGTAAFISSDNLTHETWTFTLSDGTTVNKEVVLWQSS